MTEGYKKAIEHLKKDLAAIRTGRAHTGLVEPIEVEAYGQKMPLAHCATITTPDARTIVVQPWDKSLLPAIEKALQESDLGVTPASDGTRIRLSLPPLSEERRKELAKAARKRGEEAKVAIRNVRREAREAVEKEKKEGAISEDEAKRRLDAIQKETDRYIAEVDRIVAEKEKEILSF